MHNSPRLLTTLLPAWLLLCWAGEADAVDKPDAGDGKVVFETHVAPILQARCVKCHGEGQTKAGLDVRRRFALLKGGDSGPAFVAGKPGESLLVERIVKGEMPPPEEGRLDDRQLAVIRRWIEQGAPTAKATETPLDEAEAAPRLSAEDRQFWAFQPPKRPRLPQVRHADRVRTSIDAFLLARLEAKGLSFNTDAPPAVLLRRLCFDLTGLPPTPEQLDEFLADDRPGAYERLVDRLLASPAYGERWGRHWLDVAGYADSDGYLDADRLRPEAWRYRDYVIQALNDDLPYDQFLTEQLAGDELSDWRRASQLTAEMRRQLVATGFLRTALDPTYPGYTEPNEIHQVLADTMQIVGTACLGLTIHCARCHAHKYDPVSHRDYYALQAVFLPALDPARWQPSGVRGIGLASEPEQARIDQHNRSVDERVAQSLKSVAGLMDRYRRKLVADTLTTAGKPADEAVVGKLISAILQPTDKRNDEQKKLVAEYAPTLTLAEAELSGRYADFAAELARLKAQAAADQAAKTTVPLARGLADLDDKGVPGKVLLRGGLQQARPNGRRERTRSARAGRLSLGRQTELQDDRPSAGARSLAD